MAWVYAADPLRALTEVKDLATHNLPTNPGAVNLPLGSTGKVGQLQG